MLQIALVTVGVGLIAGWAGQRSRFCTVGGLRDFFIARDTTLLLGVVALFAAAWLTFPLVELLQSFTNPAVVEQAEGLGGLDPLAVEAASETLGLGADTDGGWPTLELAAVIFIGGIGVGAVSTVVGGCPFRQHVLAGQGSRQAVFYLVGFYIAALAFGLWSPTLLRFVLG
jgi:uncharacterized membrane protein YedE/YeeE